MLQNNPTHPLVASATVQACGKQRCPHQDPKAQVQTCVLRNAARRSVQALRYNAEAVCRPKRAKLHEEEAGTQEPGGAPIERPLQAGTDRRPLNPG